MGAQAILAQAFFHQVAAQSHLCSNPLSHHSMAPMKAMRAAAMKRAPGKPITKGAIAKQIAEECELKATVAGKMIASLAAIATKEVQKNGIFTFPGLCRIKTRQKPATKACKKEIFGKMQMVKAKPARTIVKAFPVAALKKSV